MPVHLRRTQIYSQNPETARRPLFDHWRSVFRKTLDDPEVLKKFEQASKDPEFLKKVERMKRDPEFLEVAQIMHPLSSSSTVLKKVDELVQDPESAKAFVEKLKKRQENR